MSRFDRLLPKPLTHRHGSGPIEPPALQRRRRRVVAGTAVLGTALLGRSLTRAPGSADFYASTAAVASVYTAGSLASGPLHRGWVENRDDSLRRPILTPVATGVAAFGVFYVGALVARRVPVLGEAVARVLAFAHEGATPAVWATTLANGAAEELFYRGALYAALETHQPLAGSTAVYALATSATRNPALVLAATAMGTLFAYQRRASGGIQAPMITHLTWSTLMLRFLPPLFRRDEAAPL
ncbi:CPBP family intramembrane glutamic endopeptidase [Nocardioides sp.]|uniref:CPBP family intramembrane glutamic endopeptidase n=1 Tax=Nocardioides sp. TaxID=35761 RepID=UPI002631B0B8|nr:CPBP family intramembrane glutamic endopeptidase [Nocardioides sp.]